MDSIGNGFKEAVPGLIQAITQCVNAHTKFSEWAQRVLVQAHPSGQDNVPHRLRPTKEFLSVRELADQLPLTPSTIRRFAKTNKIPSIRMGKKIVFNLTAVLAALERPSKAAKKLNQKDNGSKTE